MKLALNRVPRRAAVCLFLFLLIGVAGIYANRDLSYSARAQQHTLSAGSNVSTETHAQVIAAYSKLPLRFEANQGQVAAPVKFISRNSGQTLFLTADEAVLELYGVGAGTAGGKNNLSRGSQSAVAGMKLVGANRQARVVPLDELPGKSNYFLGNDTRRWRTNIPNFARVKYTEVYPGIDLVWHGDQRQLEHDFIVAPGANPRRIRWSFAGARAIQIDAEGSLVLQTDAGELKLLKPQAWQDVNGGRQQVACEYVISQQGRQPQVEFQLGAYDTGRELVIDPVLLYSSYLGGSGFEQGLGVALDKDGNIYVTGVTFESDFPGASPIQAAPGGPGGDVYVVKLNPSASTILYGTWLGGAQEDSPTAMTVDQDGSVYVTGSTTSSNFPTTDGAFQKTFNGGTGDAFVAKINAAGSALVYSSYLGGDGSDFASAIALDGGGNAYLAGITDSSNLSATGFQLKRASSGVFKTTDSAANWCSIGATLGTTQVRAVTVDPTNSNTIYVAGATSVFKSTDGGAQWSATGQGNSPISALVIAVDPTNSNVLYVGQQFSNAVLKSTNGGASYTPKSAGIPADTSVNSILDILIDPAMPNTVFIGTNGGAFKSTDGGESWSLLQGLNSGPTPSQRPRVNRLVFDPNNRSILYAATNRGAFKTADGGVTWAAINNGLGQPNLPIELLAIAVDPATPNTLYAGATGFNGGLFKTTDGGATWRTSNAGLFPPGGTVPLTVSALVIDSVAPMTLYAGTSAGVYKTTDGAANWNSAASGLPNLAINALALDRRARTNLYVGLTGGNDAFAAKLNAQGRALNWLTYLGGTATDDARGIALDKDGNVYLAGSTASTNFPTAAPLQAANAGGTDAFIAKFNPMGTALVYATYFGGSGLDAARGVVVNNAGQAHIIGTTSSVNLPTRNAVQPALGGSTDAFVTKFNAAGSATEYSTYLGGTRPENGYGIFVDGTDNAYVTGDSGSTNFPLLDPTQSQFGGGNTDAFVTKLSAAGAPLIYSALIGGTSDERGYSIAVDVKGNAYVVGDTRSINFPTVTPLQPMLRGGGDAFLLKLGIEADLAIAKTASRNPVLVNNNFIYTLTATNNGPSSATGVVVTDQLPAGVNFVSATSSQGTCANNAGTVTCNVGNLAVQGRATITLTVAPTAAGAVTNTASVQANETDSNPSNNQTQSQITISNQPSIYGRVTLASGNPLSGVTINLTGTATQSQQTNAQGFYQFANLAVAGNYTVTPASANYSFEPATRELNNLTTDQSADFVATQCAYALAPTNQSFEANGGSGSITVTAPPRCPWTASANASWIKITSATSGAGNGTVSFTVDPTETPRAGRITIADQTFLIWQGVNVCNTLKFRPRSYFLFGFPNGLQAADLDGDGLSDLIVSQEMVEFDPAQQRFAFPLVIYYGEQNGRLVPGPRIFAATVTQLRSIAVGDLNGDGRQDLVLSPGNETDVRLLLNNGNRTFIAGGNVRLSPPNTFDYPGILRAADLNKDGKLDLIGVADSKLLIALNTSTGSNVSFAPAFAVSFEGQSFRGLADVNNDGVIDLITVGGFAGSPGLGVYLGDGLGSFRQPIASPLVDFPQQTDFADFNADGNLDMAVTVQASTPQGTRFKVALLYGDGTGRFGRLAIYDPLLLNPIGQEIKLIVRDVNNDARPDVLVLGERKVRAVLTDATGKLGSVVEVGSTDDFDISAFAVGNFDGGGRPDFVTIDGRRYSFVVNWNRCNTSGLTIYGQVLDRNTPAGFGDVTVRLTGAQTATVTTDAGGNYEFTGLAPGNYTVTVERGALEFNPASQTLNNLTTDQAVNFSGVRKGTTVSSASFAGQSLAPDSIASIFGVGMSRSTEIAQEQPLPIRLANQYVYFADSAGVERTAQLFFVSPDQINFLIPAEAATGPASIHIFSPVNSNEPDTTGTLLIERVAPGLFAANANGTGVAAAVVLRVKPGGAQLYEPVSRFDGAKFVSVPIDLGPDLGTATDQVFLLLFGTGLRNNNGLTNVTVRIGGEAAEVSYAGPQGGFAGLDQLNVRLPRSLAGRGEVDVVLTVEGKQSNTVRVNIK